MERQEFETWIRRLRPRLLAEALRLSADPAEAEDTVQEAVLKLWAMRSEISEYHSADGMAIVIVRRLSLNRRRRPATAELPELQCERTPETELITAEEAERLMRLMHRLPDAQQTVFRMKHIDGLEVSEIAGITGSTVGAVRQNLSRARHRILKLFGI